VRFVTVALAGLTDDVPYNSPIPLFDAGKVCPHAQRFQQPQELRAAHADTE
jgi:hypothetical protein